MSHLKNIRVGIGGWSYAPWRKTFYPPKIKSAQELHYASRQVTTIEINSTFYRLQNPEVYAKWHDATPDGFVFTLKAPRFVTHRKLLAEADAGVQRFMESGVAELEDKLGVILWQLAPTHRYVLADVQAFFANLPTKIGGRLLRHAINVRHPSFQDSAFIDLARRFNVAVVIEDDAQYSVIADITADFVYARLRQSETSIETGYSHEALKHWAATAEQWASGEQPEKFMYASDVRCTASSRDVFVFFINGAKERAPAAARALIQLLD